MKTARRLIPSKFNLSRLSNEMQQCSARGCHSLRVGIAKHCKPHEARHKYHGDPTAPALRRAHYSLERAEVAKLFADNAEHAGLLRLVAYVQGRMDEAQRTQGEGYKGAEEIERLRVHGTTALDIVAAGVALQVHLQRSNKGGTKRHEAFLIARAVFGLQPRPRTFPHEPALARPGVKRDSRKSHSKRIRASALAHIGGLFMEAFAKVSAMASTALDTREQRKADAEAALVAPFK